MSPQGRVASLGEELVKMYAQLLKRDERVAALRKYLQTGGMT